MAFGHGPAELLDDGYGAKDPWVDELVTVAATVLKARRELALALAMRMATPTSPSTAMNASG